MGKNYEIDMEKHAELLRKIRAKKLFRRHCAINVYRNHLGKTKKVSGARSNSKNNHKRPARKYCGKKDSFTNPFGAFNVSDEQFKNFINGNK